MDGQRELGTEMELDVIGLRSQLEVSFPPSPHRGTSALTAGLWHLVTSVLVLALHRDFSIPYSAVGHPFHHMGLWVRYILLFLPRESWY